MDNFDIKEFLTENKLTESSKRLDEQEFPKGFRGPYDDRFSDDVLWLAYQLSIGYSDANSAIKAKGEDGFIKYVKKNTDNISGKVAKILFNKWWNMSGTERYKFNNYKWKAFVDRIVEKYN